MEQHFEMKCKMERENYENEIRRLRAELENARVEVRAIEEDSNFHLDNERAQVEGQQGEIIELKKRNKELKLKLKNAKELIILKNNDTINNI